MPDDVTYCLLCLLTLMTPPERPDYQPSGVVAATVTVRATGGINLGAAAAHLVLQADTPGREAAQRQYMYGLDLRGALK